MRLLADVGQHLGQGLRGPLDGKIACVQALGRCGHLRAPGWVQCAPAVQQPCDPAGIVLFDQTRAGLRDAGGDVDGMGGQNRRRAGHRLGQHDAEILAMGRQAKRIRPHQCPPFACAAQRTGEIHPPSDPAMLGKFAQGGCHAVRVRTRQHQLQARMPRRALGKGRDQQVEPLFWVKS
ncbi:MAG: hypothetical protein CL813_05740 [Confluentimicrobium sp.]|nr:hypothetical protein [Actibacterium sp.]